MPPNNTDIEHTLESLNTVCFITGNDKTITGDNFCTGFPSSLKHSMSKLIAPKFWTNDQLVRWLGQKHVLFTKISDDVDRKVIICIWDIHSMQWYVMIIKITNNMFKELKNESDQNNCISREKKKKARCWIKFSDCARYWMVLLCDKVPVWKNPHKPFLILSIITSFA